MKSIPLRAQRIAQVKFVGLALEPYPVPMPVPAPVRMELPVLRPEARFMRWLRRFASRVTGSPMAARP